MSERTVSAILSKKSTNWTNGTDNEKGSGLGLILVQEFLDYHKSELHIDSKLGVGTVFSFELPFQPTL